MRLLSLAVLPAMLLLAPCPSSGTTIHVPGDQITIQAGIDAASTGDTVLVACGTYFEHSIVMKSGICLRSETGEPDCVTIDCRREGTGIICESVDASARIEGLTITKGLPPDPFPFGQGGGIWCGDSYLTIADCVLYDNESPVEGGGIYCNHSSPVIVQCLFQDNRAIAGGGLYCLEYSSPNIVNCTFCHNDAAKGGAVRCDTYCRPAFTNCTFSRNSSDYFGGALWFWNHCLPELLNCTISENRTGWYGGGMICELSSRADLTGCIFSGNIADAGGGLYCRRSSFPALIDCTFRGNSANGGVGGGLFCHSSLPILGNCIFSENTANWGIGGAMYCLLSPPQITSCTFYGNSAGFGGALYLDPPGATIGNTIIALTGWGGPVYCTGTGPAPELTCSDIFGNEGGDWVECIADQFGVNGNFSADPLFCYPQNGDFRLSADSPCAPAQQPDCGLIGACDVACGVTASLPTTWGFIKRRFEPPQER